MSKDKIQKKLEDAERKSEAFRKTDRGRLFRQKIRFSHFIIERLKELNIKREDFAQSIKLTPEEFMRLLRREKLLTLKLWSKIMIELGYEDADLFSVEELDRIEKRESE